MTIRIALALSLALSLPAQQKKDPPQTDWVELFNGKDFSNWEEVGKEKWTIEGKIIRGVAISKAYGYLQTKKHFKDFEMSLRFKCQGNGNSGLFFHVGFKPGTPDVSQGLQFEIDCRLNQHTGGIYGDGRGWVVWPNAENESVVRRNEWNDMTVKVVGNRYWSRVNGVTMIDFTDPSPKSFDGPVALQLHSGGEGDMLFSDILVRDLSKR